MSIQPVKGSGSIQVGEKTLQVDSIDMVISSPPLTAEELARQKEGWARIREMSSASFSGDITCTPEQITAFNQEFERIMKAMKRLYQDITRLTPKPHAHRKRRSQRRMLAYARQRARMSR